MGDISFHNFLTTVEKGLGVCVEEKQKVQFQELEGLYREWNGKVNVISRRDIDNLYLHHVLHSLSIASFIKNLINDDFSNAIGEWNEKEGKERLRFLDVGTGGGFPGIPLAILFPNAHFTLCDSIAKKTRVVADIAGRLGLENVKVVTVRAEELTDTYNYIVSRATASLSDLFSWTLGRFDRGLLCLKGGDIVDEIAEAVKKFRLAPSSIHIWSIENQLKDEYFRDKFVIFYKNFCK